MKERVKPKTRRGGQGSGFGGGGSCLKPEPRRRLSTRILCLLALGWLAASAARADGGAGVSQGQEYHRFKQYVRWSE